MANSELLLGFDAREMWYYEDAKAMGKRTTNGIGFLRADIKKGLSIDPSIWGSVFDTGDCAALIGEERRHAGLGTLKLPDWIGANTPFWKNLLELESYLASHDSEIIKPYWIIAVTRLQRPQYTENSSDKWPHLELTNPPSLLPEWKLIGFDIASDDGEAYLTGVEFRGDKQYLKSLCKHWGQRINEYHLFSNLTDALDYKEFENHRDPYHAPYFVYGIWLIKEAEK